MFCCLSLMETNGSPFNRPIVHLLMQFWVAFKGNCALWLRIMDNGLIIQTPEPLGHEHFHKWIQW